MEFDAFLDRYIGQFGRYQVWLMLFISIENIFIAFHILSPVFLVGEPKHHCELPPINLSNCTRDDFLYFAIPVDKDGELSSCQMYQRNYSQVTDYDVCLNGKTSVSNETVNLLENVPLISCDSWEYESSVFKKTMVTEWDLVCEDQYKASSVSAVYMAGWLAGLIIFGFVADWIGRKKVVIMTGFIYVAAGIAVGLVPNLPSALAMRFLQACCGSGKTTATIVMLSEMVGPDWRTFVLVVYFLYWVAGYVFMAGLAYLFREWRTLELIISSPEIIYFLIFIFAVPESPRWLLSKNKHVKARAILHQMARCNNRECPEQIHITESEERIGTALDLIRSSGLRKSTFILIIIWFACGFVYYGLSLNTSDLGGSPYLNFLIAGALELPAYLLLIPILRHFGRIYTFVAFMLTAGVFLLCVAAIPRDIVWLVVTVSMTGKFCISCAFLIIWFYTVELYPTEIRSIGINYISTISRVSAFLASYVALLSNVHMALPPVIFGILALVSGLSSFFLAETKGAPLLQTVIETEAFIQKASRSFCKSTSHEVKFGHEEEINSLKCDYSEDPDYLADGSTGLPPICKNTV